MNPVAQQLHDIEGLDYISSWPLAIGWWILIVLFILIIVSSVFYLLAFKRSWKNDTLQKLAFLEKNLSDATALETLIALSEYLRRIALKRFSRKECAGLTGTSWLKWLATHDPKKFDWEAKGTPLIEAPYARVIQGSSLMQVKDLIQATKNWVR